MAQPWILTLDIGTSSTRALLYDTAAHSLPGISAQRANQPQISPAGDVTFDLATLTANVVAVIDEAVAAANIAGVEIVAVATGTFVTNIVGIDDRGNAVTPIFTYAHPSSSPAAQTLRAELGAIGCAATHDRTGCVVHSSYLPARFTWMQQTQPGWMTPATNWMTLGAYLLHLFTGIWTTSFSAAAWTGLLDRRRLCWDAAWLDRLGVGEEQLGRLADITPGVIGLQPAWAQRWPTLAHVPWLPALGDGAAANVGSGAVTGHAAALTVGTTAALRAVVSPDLARVPDGLWLYRVTAAEGLLGGATTEGGNLLSWLRSTLQLPPLPALEAALAQATPARHGLTLLPFIAGERAPGWNDAARAMLHGFTLHTTPLDIYQAAVEAISYRLALIWQGVRPHLGTAAGQPPHVVASGGALTASPFWLQTMADVLNAPVWLAQSDELTSRGLAITGLWRCGLTPALAALAVQPAAVYRPSPSHHARHQAALAQQATAYAVWTGSGA